MAKSKKTTETTNIATLTTQQLEQSGIRTNLNQNDIVEIISTEAYDRIMASLESIPKFNNNHFKDYSKLDAQFIKKVKASKHYEESMDITPSDINHHQYEDNTTKKLLITYKRIDIEESNNDKIKLILKSSTYSIFISGNLKLDFTRYSENNNESQGDFEVFRGCSRIVFSQTFPYKSAKTEDQILAEVEEHNQKVMDFYNNIPVSEKIDSNGIVYKLISYDTIAKQARVHVNKNIIKNQAPEVTQQLNNLFGITL